MQTLLDMMKTTLPKYNTIQPSTGKMISYRPFTVKEEKVLLIANTTGTYEDFLRTLADVIDSCFELKTPALKLPLFDIEYFFLKLRGKSVSEIAEPTIICPHAKTKVKLKIDLDTIEPKFDPKHNKEIEISSNIKITMNYPILENFIQKNGKNLDYYDMVIECIEKIETPTELIEAKTASPESIKEFVDLLTKNQFLKIIEFFKTMPKIEKEVNYISAGEQRTLTLKGMRDFFQ